MQTLLETFVHRLYTTSQTIYANTNNGNFEYCSKVSAHPQPGYSEFCTGLEFENYYQNYWRDKDFFKTKRYQEYKTAFRTPEDIEIGKRGIAVTAFIKEINEPVLAF